MTATAMQQPGKATVTLSGDREIRIERIVNASRDRVWKALTDPALLAQWWGRGNELDIEKHELVRGGHWRYVEHAHGEKHGFEGRFAEVVPQQKIVSTFEWDGMPGHVALQTLTLDDLGDGRTRISTISLFHTGADRDGMVSSGMEGGMNESYDALDRVLASMA